jgi:hypothetical protein
VDVVDLLAQNYFGNTRSGSIAGPVGAFIIAVLVVATVLLIRNMNMRIRRLPARFPGESDPPQEQASGTGDGQRTG